MRVQQQTKNQKDNFNKNEGVLLSDNKQDEMMAKVLELYPQQTSYMLMGAEGDKKKEELKKEVRKYFDKLQEEDDAFNLSGWQKIKKGLKKGLKKVGKVVARASLAVPRGAALGLIRLNFRGAAKRFDLLNSKGEEKLMKKWEDIGGKRDSLNKAIRAGKDKKPTVCGKKCRAKAGANPKLEGAYENFEPSATSLVVAGGAVLGSLIGVVGTGVNNNKNYKNTQNLMKLEAELKEKEREAQREDDKMTPSEKKIADEIIKAQQSNNDPLNAIANNPNLTAEEKAEAINQLKQLTKSTIGIDTSKKFVLVGVLLIAGFLGWQYYKNKQTN